MTAWDVAYEGTPTWDVGHPQGAVVRLLERGAFEGSVLDVGTGTGAHALLLAARGHRVVGVDIAARAIEKATTAAAGLEAPPRFLVGDALALEGPGGDVLGGPFDTALDVGLFHALRPDQRRRYARSLAAVVRPGGRALVIAWSARNPFGLGPERIDRTMLRRSFVAADGWRIEMIEPEVLETRLPAGRVEAWLATLRRR
jgi:SAM-dependent methyltransferase